MRKEKICISCGIKHHSVEAGGIRYCPNPVCKVCGANWFKNKFIRMEDGEEYYNFIEVSKAALEWVKECKDEVISNSVLNTIKKRAPEIFNLSEQTDVGGGHGESEL